MGVTEEIEQGLQIMKVQFYGIYSFYPETCVYKLSSDSDRLFVYFSFCNKILIFTMES